MRLSLCPFSLCLSAFFSLNVAPSVWLTAWLCSCWQLRLLPQDNISPPHLSLHLSNHPSLLPCPAPLSFTPSSLPASYCSSPFSSSSPALLLFLHFLSLCPVLFLFFISPPPSSGDTNHQVPSICVYVSN